MSLNFQEAWAQRQSEEGHRSMQGLQGLAAWLPTDQAQQEITELKKALAASEELSRQRLECARESEWQRRQLLERCSALDTVALCAARYVKAQSARYQRELLEAIDALERMKVG